MWCEMSMDQAKLSLSSPPPSSPGRGGEDKAVRAGGAAATAGPSYPTFIGKHKMTAAISHLHNQINIIQEELNQLETIGESSIVCKDLISTVESTSDPLLPWSKGPADVVWDRWFRGAHNSRNHNRWI